MSILDSMLKSIEETEKNRPKLTEEEKSEYFKGCDIAMITSDVSWKSREIDYVPKKKSVINKNWYLNCFRRSFHWIDWEENIFNFKNEKQNGT